MSTKPILKSVVAVMVMLGLGIANVARADTVSYGNTAYGPSYFTVSDGNVHCMKAVYTGGIADPSVLISYMLQNGLKTITIMDIGSKDASRVFDAVNQVTGVRATYNNATEVLVLSNMVVKCPCMCMHHKQMMSHHKYGKHHMQQRYMMGQCGVSKPVMKGVIAEHVSGGSVISAASQAPGFEASTSSDGSYIYNNSPDIMAYSYQTGEGLTPLYTH